MSTVDSRPTRHELVWLTAAGWRHAAAQLPQGPVGACVAHWARNDLPLVVGRQATAATDLALGISAPILWERRKIALRVPASDVSRSGRFPAAQAIGGLLSADLRAPWAQLWQGIATDACDVRVYGSYGWQCLSGLRHVTASSDLDLLLPVADVARADAVCSRLANWRWNGPRVDGELLFPDGGAVAWREWMQLRCGSVDRILVKRRYGADLESGSRWLAAMAPQCVTG